MISARNMTVWGICWSGDPTVTSQLVRVLRYCKSFMDCERFLLIAASDFTPFKGLSIIRINPLKNMGEFNLYVNNVLPRFIQSDYAMSVHEDGFPVRPDLWRPEFLSVDYIGAPWPNGVVGNGGFNIESRKLMQAKLRLPRWQQEKHPSDNWLCIVNRQRLEQQGIKFAGTELGLSFSTEFLGRDRPSFGFHGRICCPAKYAEGWSKIEHFERTQ